MPVHTRFTTPAISAAILATLAGASTPAHATVRSWITAAGGTISTAANWSPAGVPVAADVLNFNLASTYTLTFNSTVPASSQLNFSSGVVTINASSPHDASAQLVLGLAPGSNSQILLNQGQIGSSGSIALGAGVNSSGTLTIASAAGVLRASGAASTLAVGNSAAGTLNINGGGLALCDGRVFVSRFAGSSGAINIDGAIGPLQSSLETTSNTTSGDITVALSGNGTISVTNGGHIECAHDLIIAPTAGFVGAVNLHNLTNSTPSTLFCPNQIHVGHNTTSAAAGDGTLSFYGLTALETSRVSIFVGDPDGGHGTLRMEGAIGEIRSLVCDPPHSTLILSAGASLRVLSGPLVTPSTMVLDSGTPVLDAEISCDFGPDVIFPDVTLGNTTIADTNRGTLDLVTSTITCTGDMVIGNNSGSSGTVSVGGDSMAFPGRTITVGRAGSGVLSGSGGTAFFNTFSGGSLALASLPSGTGSASIRAGTISLTGGVTVGCVGNSNPATILLRGDLSSTINGDIVVAGTNAILRLFGTTTAPTIRLNGAASVLDAGGSLTAPIHIGAQGATMTIPPTVTLNYSGSISLDPGVTSVAITGGSINLRSAASFTGAGSITGSLQSTFGSIIVATGPLTLGDTSNPSGVALSGQLLVQNNTVTLRDADVATIADTSINGGTLVGPAGGILLNRSLSGIGSITTPVFLNRNTSLGVVRPVGQLAFTGNYNQALAGPGTTGGTLQTDVAGVSSFNRISVTGTATLGGTLRASFIGQPQDEPPVGTTFVILSAGSVNGQFQNVDTPGFEIEYTSTNVRLRWVGLPVCPADFNEDGNLNADDLGDFITCFFTSPPCPSAEFNSDGNVNADDLGDFITAFFQGC